MIYRHLELRVSFPHFLMFFSSVTMKIPQFLFSFLWPPWCPCLYSVVWFFFPTPFSSQMVTSHSLLIVQSNSFGSKRTWGASFSFLKKIELLKVMKGILPGFWLAAQSCVCESVEGDGGQWDWCILAGFACDPQHSRKSGHNRPRICVCTPVWEGTAQPLILDVVTGCLKPAGAYEFVIVFHGT